MRDAAGARRGEPDQKTLTISITQISKKAPETGLFLSASQTTHFAIAVRFTS
jgi:hypothetical protein